MRQIFRPTLLISFLLFSSICLGQALKGEIDNIYNFKPSKLSKSEQEAKVPNLDTFWNKIKLDTASYLPQLRSELNTPGHNPYFYFDGASLLLYVSKNRTDEQIAANAIVNSDFEDIDRGQYVKMLNRLANDGANVTKAALKVLSDKDFQFFVPEHVLTFDQGMSLTYMLLPEKPELYVDSLITRFKGASPKAQISILSVLFYAYACKGDAFIKEAINDPSLKKDVRKTAKEMMSEIRLSEDESNYVKNAGEGELADLRKKSLQRFSDEAIEELALTTKVLRKNSACR